jgi:hypothetical protein
VASQPENVANLNDPTESCTEKTTPSSMSSPIAETVKTTTPIDCGKVADKCFVSVQLPIVVENFVENTVHAGDDLNKVQPNVVHSGLSPRLEMRLALNNDILGDEDLINYNPTPDLISILGHDLSTYHRMTGKDIIMNHIINRPLLMNNSNNHYISSSNNNSNTNLNMNHNNNHNSSNEQNWRKDGTSSLYPQNNSKMDTPIPSRKKTSHSTWSSFGFAERSECKNDVKLRSRLNKSICFIRRRKQSIGFGEVGEAGENLLHDTTEQ